MIRSEIPWFFSTIFPWPFVLVGGGMVYDGLRELKRAHQSHRWQKTEGKVVASFVKKREADEESAESYSVEIQYQFIVDGNLKSSNRLGLADINDGRKAIAEVIVRKYPRDSCVQVYLSPHDSDVAVLEPGVCWPHISSLLIGMFFLLAGMAMLWGFGWWTWIVGLVESIHVAA